MARQRLSHLLDAAERGERVVIERHGVQFALTMRKPVSSRARHRSPIAWMDPAVERGQWTWDSGSAGLEFSPTRHPVA